MLVANQQATELTELRIGALHNPAAHVSPQLPSILVAPLLVVLPVGRDQVDAAFLQSLPQRVGVVAAVGRTYL